VTAVEALLSLLLLLVIQVWSVSKLVQNFLTFQALVNKRLSEWVK
jgi:hypothetical protein